MDKEDFYYIPEAAMSDKPVKPGDLIWVQEDDGGYWRGRITCKPWNCEKGGMRVLVEGSDGVWEEEVRCLKREVPKSGFPNNQVCGYEKELIEMVKKREGSKNGAAKGDKVLCQCGCGEKMADGGKKGRLFKQGHDARFHGRVRKLKDGRLAWKDLELMIQPYAMKFYKAAASGGVKKSKKAAVVAVGG